MEDVLDKFQTFTEKPVKFLTVQKDVKDDITSLVKSLYDLTKSEEIGSGKKKKGAALPKLLVNNFDEEQIWQQIDLQNSECWDQLVWEVANCMSTKKDLTFPVTVKGEEVASEEDEENDDDEENDELEDKNLEENEGKHKSKKVQKSNLKKNIKSSIVDDKFFKLNEMEQFLLKEEREKKVASDSEDSIDLFDDVDDESGEEDAQGMYNDFFDGDDDGNGPDGEEVASEEDEENENDLENQEDDDRELDDKNMFDLKEKKSKQKDKKVRFAEMDDSESDDESTAENDEPNTKNNSNTDEKKSDFEQRQDRLKQTIDRLETKMLKDAPWQLKGEVDALKRPQNSLLEEVVDFDLTSRPPPIITEQTTLTLEDIIRQRIKDKAWDDVERKEKPVDDQLLFRKTEIIDQSKSKLSLAQVYEAEYLKQKKAASGDKEEEQEPEAHKEVKEAMTKLFSKLDALCHYHYTPKAPQAEVKIVSNTPAISMEEVAPVATSEAALLAPEEVKKKRRGDLMSKEERSATDKNRERRKKKQLQRSKGTVAKVTEHRNTKKAVEANDKSLKTSKAFFQQLNDEATSIIKKKRKNKGQ